MLKYNFTVVEISFEKWAFSFFFNDLIFVQPFLLLLELRLRDEGSLGQRTLREEDREDTVREGRAEGRWDGDLLGSKALGDAEVPGSFFSLVLPLVLCLGVTVQEYWSGLPLPCFTVSQMFSQNPKGHLRHVL